MPGSDEDVESEAGIRALVPVALSGTCAGAVQGALLAIGVAGVLSVAAMCVVKAAKSKDGLGWVEAAAMARCPGVVIAVWAFVQMGLVVCGARLATAEDGDRGDVVLGVVGVIAGAVLPVVCIVLAWSVVSRRCYRLGQVPAAVAGRSGVVVWARSVFLPSYELDAQVYPVSKAFSTVVGRTKRPSCVYAGLSSMQPVVMLLVDCRTTKKFLWNPKEYVPLERPYTMLYEEDFTPPDDDDMNLEMEDAKESGDEDQKQVSLDDDDLSQHHQGSGNSISFPDTSDNDGLGYRHHSNSSIDASVL